MYLKNYYFDFKIIQTINKQEKVIQKGWGSINMIHLEYQKYCERYVSIKMMKTLSLKITPKEEI